jgi:TolA-binding protein
MITENFKKSGASAILVSVFTGLVVFGVSFLFGLFNSADIEARSELRELQSKHLSAIERINKVESRSEYNQATLNEIKHGIDKLNDKIDKLREAK